MTTPAKGITAQLGRQINNLTDWFGNQSSKIPIKTERIKETIQQNWANRGTDGLDTISNTDGKIGIGERPIAYAARHPIYASAGLVGGIIADQAMGKPIEGVVDAFTGNLLNLRPDEQYGNSYNEAQLQAQLQPRMTMNELQQSGGSYAESAQPQSRMTMQPNDLSLPTPMSLPTLSAEDLSREIQRQQKNMAVSGVTVEQLRRMQAQQNQTQALRQ